MRSLVIAIIAAFLGAPTGVMAQGTGRYLDTLKLQDVGDGRRFDLISEYRYVDSRDIRWIVPRGTRVDGASIPPRLWSIVGGPWDGLYRNASVIHDYFFDQKKYASDEIHWVFYDAMLTSGVSTTKAKVMYFAVLRFNPRWRESAQAALTCPEATRCSPSGPGFETKQARYVLETPKYDAEEMAEVARMIEERDPSVAELEELAKSRRVFEQPRFQAHVRWWGVAIISLGAILFYAL